MHARVSFYDLQGTSPEEGVRAFESSRPDVEAMDGNRGGMLLVDPEGARAITITFWESAEAMRASDEQARQVRGQATGPAGITIRGVEGYEVALEFGR